MSKYDSKRSLMIAHLSSSVQLDTNLVSLRMYLLCFKGNGSFIFIPDHVF